MAYDGPADAARLLSCLESQAIPKVARRGAKITRVRRLPARSATSYRAEIVEAQLSDGSERRFFLKDYGDSQRPRPGLARRRERELGVYRHLIGGGELGTARYCGAVWDERAGVHWLLLELVSGTPLRRMNLGLWIEAARWLARFQGRFARAPLPANAMPLLERHDARFFESEAERARRSVSSYAAFEGRLDWILKRYEASIDLLAGEESALVHGHYDAANILVDAGTRPVRICPVDWELASVGSRAFDLASLSDGFLPFALYRIWNAYAEEAADAGLSPPGRDRLRRLVEGFWLFRVIRWLGSAAEKDYSPAGVDRLLARGEKLASAVES